MALPALGDLPQSASVEGYWHLDEESGSRADVSGNSNTLSDNNNVASDTGINEDGASSPLAADFEKASDMYLSIIDSSQTGLDLTADISFFAWLNIESDPGSSPSEYRWMTKQGTTNNFEGYSLRYADVSGLQLEWQISNGTINEQESVAVDLETGVWKHVGVTYDASAKEVKFWVDGVQSGSTQTFTSATGANNNTAPFVLGSRSQGDIDHYDGLMQDAIIWGATLTAAEVEDLYKLYTVAPNTFFPRINAII